MGSVSSILSTALPIVLGGVDLAQSRKAERAERGRAEQQLAAQQALAESSAVAGAALEREQIALNSKITEEERKAALRRAVARQRANFGAQGVGSSGGSSQAVLLGLFEESDAEKQRREEMDRLRLRVLDDDVANRRSTNILQRTQMLERNRLDEMASSAAAQTRVAKLAGGLL